MAKKSKIAAELRRQKVVERYAERRAELKRASVNPHLSQAERDEAMAALHALPRDASPHPSASARHGGRAPTRIPARHRDLPGAFPRDGAAR